MRIARNKHPYHYPTEVVHCMPINLKKVLNKYQIKQIEWSRVLIQDGGSGVGKPLSQPAANRILNAGEFPVTSSVEKIIQQTELFLKKIGISKEDLSTIWEVDRDSPGFDVQRRIKKRGGKLKLINKPETIELPEPEMLSKAAKAHFKLFSDPFQNDVKAPEDVFLDSDQRYVREAMYQTAKHGGFLAVIGESGAGKTTLRRDLIDRIQRENAPVTAVQPRIIDKGRLTTGAICDAITIDLQPNAKLKQSLEAKARQIENLLLASSRSGNNHVLIIEESHDLTVPTLKYLKRFWELEDGFKKLLAIILIGQPELKDLLDERMNWQAREVIRRCEVAELKPLNGNLENYLSLKFQRHGRELDSVFDADAFDALRNRLTLSQRSNGQAISMLYPLVVNNAVTKAMNLASEIGAPKVNADIIREI